MMRKLSGLVALVGLLLPLAAPSFAQERAADALIISAESGLWLSNEQGVATAPTDLPETADYTRYGPIQLSPTGRFVAFQSVLPNYPGASGPTPTQLYALDLNTNDIITLYEQTDVDFSVSRYEDISDLVAWSPDGARVAFITLSSGPTAQLHVVDVVNQVDTVVNSNIPISVGVPFAPDPVWTSLGVAIITSAISGDVTTEILHIYDPTTGDEVLTVDFSQDPTVGGIDIPVEYFVAQRGNDEILVISTLSAVVFYNLSTQRIDPFEGVLQMSVRDTGLTLNYLPLGAQGGLWEADTPDGARFRISHQGLWRDRAIAISPTGQTLAYANDGIQLWANGAELGLVSVPTTGPLTPSTSSIAWGPARWQIVEGGYG